MKKKFQFNNIIGKSKKMQEIYRVIAKVASTDSTVLIYGQSGTGKELIARSIHRQGNRKNGPFVAINCAAIPSELMESEMFGHEKGAFTGADRDKPGLLETANGGTFLLDELTEMSMPLQAKLLRVLEVVMDRDLVLLQSVVLDRFGDQVAPGDLHLLFGNVT